MKKVIIGLLLTLVLISSTVYILIPKNLPVSKVTVIKANGSALYRTISSEEKWAKWWPVEKGVTSETRPYSFNGYLYRLDKPLYQAVDVQMIYEGTTYPGRIMIIPMSPDSVAVRWESTLKTSSNPFTRYAVYRRALTMRKNMEGILDSLKIFSENIENVYDYHVHRTTIKDTFLVATKITSNGYPTTEEIYNLVSDLKKYIASEGARENNYPMLNVSTNDSIHYVTTVAIPTNRKLEGRGPIVLKQLIIYPNKTLTAEVKGGPAMIKKAYRELDTYLNDYIISTPVIHWESLITDRSQQPDTTQWITKIFMPIV
jgi:hypothetical protein